jgi:phosphate transport system substrate-binding protein
MMSRVPRKPGRNSGRFRAIVARKQFLVFSAGLVLTACAPNRAITLKGPQPFVGLAQKWATAYTNAHPAISIQVTGGSADAGLTALANKKTHLAVATRKLKPSELQICIKRFGRRPNEYRVALDGVAVYVHAENPVTELELDQLREIFNGTIRNWSQVGGPRLPITLYAREKNSAAYELFKDRVLQGANVAASAQTMPGSAGILKAVSRDKGGIGFSGPTSDAGAKTLKIKRSFDARAIEPTEAAVVEGRYPIRRYVFIYLNPATDQGPVADYLNWIRSDEGQGVAKEAGYYPLPAKLREKPHTEP